MKAVSVSALLLLAFANLSLAAPVKPLKPAKVPSVAGTTWSGTDFLGTNVTTLSFEQDGSISYTTRGKTCQYGTWKQDGAKLSLEFSWKDKKQAEYVGEISGDTIEGNFIPAIGQVAKWKMTKDK